MKTIRKTPLLFCLALATALLLANGVWAMTSANYRLDWFTPLTGSGGPAISANYSANFTVGQTVAGSFSNSASVGYWAPFERQYLPMVCNAGP